MKPSTRLSNSKYDLRWIFLLVIVLLIIILVWPAPASGAALHQAATLLPGGLTATPTIIPQELLSTPDQTSGIICGAVVIVLIIVGGTFGVLRRQNGRRA